MDSGERRSVKRSRFDQTEPEPKRVSRFDRRSRSPPSKRDEPPRDRSPLSRERDTSADDKAPKRPDPAAAAAAIAARISEQLQGRKGSEDPSSAHVPTTTSAKATASVSAANINGEIYVSDGDYIKDIEVNDLRNRYIVTKASTQKMIKDETGADVTTRGSYLPDKSMASASNPPLYLHVTSTSKEGLEKAIAKINDLIHSELPPLVDERRFRRREREDQPPVERDEYGRKKWPDHRIPVDLEPIPGFNLRAQVVGHGGAYVKHIQQETDCRVQIKGHGSGFIESATGRESDEPMYLHVTGPDAAMVDKAKELCEDLLENVKEQYESFKNRPPRSYGDRQGNNGGHYGGYNEGPHNGTGPGSVGTPGTPTSATAGTPTAASAADYSAQYAQYYGTADPYAAYGGYAAYVQYYQQYYAAAQQAQQQQGTPAPPGVGSSGSPPPPPPSEAPPPPPPSEIPPPPGL
ncbi:kh domain-containing protein [Ophiostoma piceae UAMH 11346]|uniref:Kh domain-containing protein n=1 Tax=Ophiostoma piceae (strain UAMH 11346) TaxID=1262450 RepID=S3CMP8_OPHP1|nr:kh domain-containing protein [Ophiostoma piceae UAMH 11346]